jgi:2-polyprenyl-3-methyl-5-hydroxy-6-metoxy-1,4-benzoquinol methylase
LIETGNNLKNVFIPRCPVELMKPADYNPREISEESLKFLYESVNKLGVIKPILIDNTNTIIAGHQRLKSVKYNHVQYVPVIKFADRIKLGDMVQFNIAHNIIDGDNSSGRINCDLQFGWNNIPLSNFSFEVGLDAVNVDIVGKTEYALTKYGNWSYVVCDSNNKIIENSYLAQLAFLAGYENSIVYRLTPEQTDYYNIIRKKEYGRFNMSNSKESSAEQGVWQPPRSFNSLSQCYDMALTWLRKENKTQQRILDFGSGLGRLIPILERERHIVFPYEPSYIKFNEKFGKYIRVDKVIAMIDAITADIKKNGLFDVVIVDSVLNATINNTACEDVVMSASGLLKADGIAFFTSCNHKKVLVEAVDESGFVMDVSAHNNNIQIGRVMTPELMVSVLEVGFSPCRASNNAMVTRGWAEHKKPIERTRFIDAIEREFNMDYNGYKHNKHNELLQLLLKENYGE